jgi:hypothetical protein
VVAWVSSVVPIRPSRHAICGERAGGDGSRRGDDDASMSLVGADLHRAVWPQLAVWAAQSAASSCGPRPIGHVMGRLFQSQGRCDARDPRGHQGRPADHSGATLSPVFEAASGGAGARLPRGVQVHIILDANARPHYPSVQTVARLVAARIAVPLMRAMHGRMIKL